MVVTDGVDVAALVDVTTEVVGEAVLVLEVVVVVGDTVDV